MCICMCMYVCMYIYIYRERERCEEMQRERESDVITWFCVWKRRTSASPAAFQKSVGVENICTELCLSIPTGSSPFSADGISGPAACQELTCKGFDCQSKGGPPRKSTPGRRMMLAEDSETCVHAPGCAQASPRGAHRI